MRARLFAAAAIAVAAWTAQPAAARAELRRVALVDAGPELVVAVAMTLRPWGIDVVAVDEAAPGDQLPTATPRAHQLALDHQAGSVVWITSSTEGAFIWIYDRHHQHVVARSIPTPPPFDEPTAAAVALSIKTLLRHSQVAPTNQRFGAERRPKVLRMESWLGVRARPSGDGGGEPRLAVALAWRSPLVDRAISLRLAFRSGPGTSVSENGFVGRHADTSVSAGASYRLVVGDRFELQPGLGATLQRATLDGVVLNPAAAAKVNRWNPAIDASVVAAARIGELWLGVRAEASYLTRHQEFLVRGVPVFELSSSAFEVALVAGVSLY